MQLADLLLLSLGGAVRHALRASLAAIVPEPIGLWYDWLSKGGWR